MSSEDLPSAKTKSNSPRKKEKHLGQYSFLFCCTIIKISIILASITVKRNKIQIIEKSENLEVEIEDMDFEESHQWKRLLMQMK